MPFDYLPPLFNKTKTKIVLLVMDGLGGIPFDERGLTALEAAKTPNLDKLAVEGTLGQTIPLAPGITPGSGPAHLALFGYDPLNNPVGRGILESLGVGLTVRKGEVAARGNFCTLDENGLISDRRAGRISTVEALPVVKKLQQVQIPGVQVEVRHVKEYRFAVVMRGVDLDERLADTDPQRTGAAPLPIRALDPAAKRTADLFNQWVAAARAAIADEPKANGLTLRGFSTDPGLQPFAQAYNLKPACVAVYPMYRGVSQLVGMDIVSFEGETPADEFAAAARLWDDYDFIFIHIKKTDSMGEDGNFEGKVHVIETVDEALPQLMALKPDVLMVTGDHATPCKLRSHSWHPVPFLLWAPATVRADAESTFGERACARGGLGTFPARQAMPLALAHAGRLDKFGA
ncbi:MAG: 2,3-bisphosphoglycerate-independent phosphoglycerate mutase [Anaerolineales bacterium]